MNTEALFETAQRLNGISQALENSAHRLTSLDFEDIGHPALGVSGFKLKASNYRFTGGDDLEELISSLSVALGKRKRFLQNWQWVKQMYTNVYGKCEERLVSIDGVSRKNSKEKVAKGNHSTHATSSESESQPVEQQESNQNENTPKVIRGLKRNEAESAVEFLFGSKAFRNAKLWTQGKSDLADLRDLLTMDSSELRLDDIVKIVAMLKGQMLYAKHDYGCSAKTIVNELNDGVLGSLKADKVIKVSADKIRQINEATGPVDVQDKNKLQENL